MQNNQTILLATDLDRTLLPNGQQIESPEARPLFRALVQHASIRLVYISGRDLQRVLMSIQEYALPIPDFIVSDVGSTIYQPRQDKSRESLTHTSTNDWVIYDSWQQHLAPEWSCLSRQDIVHRLDRVMPLSFQEESKQSVFKLSFEVKPSVLMANGVALLETKLQQLQQEQALKQLDFQYQIVTSIDETCDQGLVDVLPKSAGKLGALQYLVKALAIPREKVFFSGDSGNDKSLLLSEFNGCVVKNATEAFKRELQHEAALEASGNNQSMPPLYFCTGALHPDLNGNYSAGIVEGFTHFFPFSKNWIFKELL